MRMVSQTNENTA